MEKALRFLKHMKQTDTPYNFRECELDEAIAELEATDVNRREWYQKGFNEAMKQRTCDGCKHRSHLDESLTNKTTNGFCVENGFFTRYGVINTSSRITHDKGK